MGILHSNCKSGDEIFLNNGQELPLKLLDFWRWANSDLLNNTLLGILAEFIIASAIGIGKTTSRTEWDAFDLKTEAGLTIEVKSAAYIQAWIQRNHSKIGFSIAPTQSWNTETSSYTTEIKRQAHLYIFALLHHQQKATINPLDVSQWTFYILETEILNQQCKLNKTIGLNSLLKLNPITCNYDEIKAHIASLENKFITNNNFDLKLL